MGMTAALKLRRVIANTRLVLAIEAIAAAQALEFLKPLQPSPRGQKAYAAIRAVSPAIEQDRVLAPEFVRVAEVIAGGAIAAALV